MRKIILLLCVALVLLPANAGTVAAADSTAQAAVSEGDLMMARFLAGAALLRSVSGLSDEAKFERFRGLEAASGVTASEALLFLDGCRANPLRYKEINDLALSILTEILSAPAPVESAGAANEQKERRRLWQGR